LKDLYYIFSEHGKVGPLDSFEIRAALRVGEVDPFDLASKVDSKIKRAIVEIDEIFATPEDQFSDENMEETLSRAVANDAAPGQRDVGYRPENSLIKTAQANPLKKVQQKERDKLNTAKRKSRESSKSPNKNANKKDQKRYYIHTKKAKYGPFSARDIIAKHNLGDLSSSTAVQKVGVKMKVPIDKFVKIYQKNQNPNIKAKLRNSRLGLGSDNKELTTRALWIMVGIAAALLFYFTLEKAKETKALKREVKQKSQEFNIQQKTVKPEPVKPIPSRAVDIQTSKPIIIKPIRSYQKPTRIIVNKPQRQIIKAKPKPKRITKKSYRKRPKPIKVVKPRVVKKPKVYAPKKTKNTYRPRSNLNVKTRPQKFTTIAKYSTKPSSKKTIKAKPVVSKPVVKKRKRPTKNPPKRNSTSSLGSIPNISGKMGQKMSFGPVSYSTSALASCPAKCVLTFSGRGGTSIKATFFKARFGSQLSKKGGKASVSGLVTTGNRFLLQNVN